MAGAVVLITMTRLDIAASLGRRIDDVLAEHAYAAEAALDYCRRNRPDLPTGHVAIIGFSAGSLVVPTVAARLGDDVEAAVLIAGGANLLEIAMDSALSDGGIRIKWGQGRGGPEDKQRLLDAYLEHSKLDLHNTAPTPANKPVLQYWGSGTRVPGASRSLYEQLNHPDKVTFLGGHAVVLLPADAGGADGDWSATRWTHRRGVAGRGEEHGGDGMRTSRWPETTTR
jgi:pimeloyl-ACP methyl ester carboxylesterase